MMDKEDAIYRTSILLVEHFKDCLEREDRGINSRIFSKILHPEENFVAVGQSQEVIDGAPVHPEHIVPCAVLIDESIRLIKANMPNASIAKLLAKHWKIAYISKEQASFLDTKKGLNLASSMPDGWCFETGDTYARLNKADIKLLPLTN